MKFNRVLITGGLGFIGSHLVKGLLGEAKQIWVIDDCTNNVCHVEDFEVSYRTLLAQLVGMYAADDDLSKRIIFAKSDFTYRTILSRVSSGFFDKVFHLAAKPRVQWSVENPVISTNENFNKSIVLAKACSVGKTRLIFSSTAAVYDSNVTIPTIEDDQIYCNPISPYGMAKYATEKYLRLFQSLYNLDWVALRYFNVYGPKQSGNSPYATAVAAWCSKALANESLRSDGDGTQTRDMIHVDDVVSANMCVASAAIGSSEARIFNVGSGKSYSNNQILEMFASRGYKNVVDAPERIGDIKHTLADIGKLRGLGWEPKIGFSEGLESVMNYWEL